MQDFVLAIGSLTVALIGTALLGCVVAITVSIFETNRNVKKLLKGKR